MAATIYWQRLEGGLILLSGLAIYLYGTAPFAWWVAVLVFFAPDVSFAGYLLGRKVGAFVYNCVHLYAIGVALIAFGLVYTAPTLAAIGALWLAHAGFDRLLGYGLKSPEGFAFTHLGRIGKPQ